MSLEESRTRGLRLNRNQMAKYHMQCVMAKCWLLNPNHNQLINSIQYGGARTKEAQSGSAGLYAVLVEQF